MSVVAVLTLTLGNLAAINQTNIKRLLAYSSISHAGYMLLGLIAGPGHGLQGVYVYVLVYTFMNLGAFLVIVALRRQNIIGEDLDDLAGLIHKSPGYAVLMLIFLLSLAGIPFFGGFLSKEEILGTVWMGGLPGPFALLMLVAFLTAFYMFRVVFVAFFGVPAPATGVAHAHVSEIPHAHEPPATMLLPLWVLALMTMAVGVYTTVGGAATAGFFVGGEHAVANAEQAVPPGWLTPAAVGAAVTAGAAACGGGGVAASLGASLAATFCCGGAAGFSLALWRRAWATITVSRLPLSIQMPPR